jgi:glycosyltransferase involved in cell wall biosynthesis
MATSNRIPLRNADNLAAAAFPMRAGRPDGALGTAGAPSRRLSVLHIALSISETNATYNDHCLPLKNDRDIAICTYFRSPLTPPPEIKLFDGGSSLSGFARALRGALAWRPYDIMHIHTQHTAILFLAVSILSGGKYLDRTVFTMHSSYPLYKFRNKLMLIPSFALLRRVVCCSEAGRECLPSHLRWLAGRRLAVVQNCLDIERLDAVVNGHARSSTGRGFTVASVGRLIELKNPLTVLKAYSLNATPTSRLVFMGAGPLKEELMGRSRILGLARNVEFTDLIPRDEVYRRLAEADLFVSASRGEGLPLAVLQAMACRCPAVLSDIPAHREIAGDTDLVPLVPVGDVQTLAEQIHRFRHMSPGERAAVGEQCRKLVESRFNLHLMHQRYSEVYAQLIPSQRLQDLMPCKSN